MNFKELSELSDKMLTEIEELDNHKDKSSEEYRVQLRALELKVNEYDRAYERNLKNIDVSEQLIIIGKHTSIVGKMVALMNESDKY